MSSASDGCRQVSPGERLHPIVRALYERMLAAGKPRKLGVLAAMTKFVRLIFGVVKSGKPFDPNWQPAA